MPPFSRVHFHKDCSLTPPPATFTQTMRCVEELFMELGNGVRERTRSRQGSSPEHEPYRELSGVEPAYLKRER